MFQVLLNLATCSNYSITNYVKIPVFFFVLFCFVLFFFCFVEKMNKGQLKIVKLLKMARSRYIVILIKL